MILVIMLEWNYHLRVCRHCREVSSDRYEGVHFSNVYILQCEYGVNIMMFLIGRIHVL